MLSNILKFLFVLTFFYPIDAAQYDALYPNYPNYPFLGTSSSTSFQQQQRSSNTQSRTTSLAGLPGYSNGNNIGSIAARMSFNSLGGTTGGISEIGGLAGLGGIGSFVSNIVAQPNNFRQSAGSFFGQGGASGGFDYSRPTSSGGQTGQTGQTRVSAGGSFGNSVGYSFPTSTRFPFF